jgi:hypothetical protein
MEQIAPNYHPDAEEVARLLPAVRETLEALEETLGQFAVDSVKILQGAEVGAAKVRDALIDHLRRAESDSERGAVRAVLEQVNVSISLIMGVAYPQGDPKKEPLEQARGILKRLEQSLLE